MQFYATIEFLKGQNAAIIDLHDAAGEWAGASRISYTRPAYRGASVRDSLYEVGYAHASRAAALKGGRLETYRISEGQNLIPSGLGL